MYYTTKILCIRITVACTEIHHFSCLVGYLTFTNYYSSVPLHRFFVSFPFIAREKTFADTGLSLVSTIKAVTEGSMQVVMSFSGCAIKLGRSCCKEKSLDDFGLK